MVLVFKDRTFDPQDSSINFKYSFFNSLTTLAGFLALILFYSLQDRCTEEIKYYTDLAEATANKCSGHLFDFRVKTYEVTGAISNMTETDLGRYIDDLEATAVYSGTGIGDAGFRASGLSGAGSKPLVSIFTGTGGATALANFYSHANYLQDNVQVMLANTKTAAWDHMRTQSKPFVCPKCVKTTALDVVVVAVPLLVSLLDIFFTKIWTKVMYKREPNEHTLPQVVPTAEKD